MFLSYKIKKTIFDEDKIVFLTILLLEKFIMASNSADNNYS